MAISSPGLGSGLDVSGIISKLMQVEQAPLTKLNTREAAYQSKISALGTLKGGVASFESALAALIPSGSQTAASKFAAFKANVSDTTIATATATSSAALSSHKLEVTQLATVHRITTRPDAFADASATIATGTLDLTVGNGTVRKITIDSSNATLGGLKDAINKANAGVTATIVKISDTDSRLLLTSDSVGTSGQIKLVDPNGMGFGFDPDDPDAGGFSQDEGDGGRAAQGSIIKLNGVEIASASNTVKDAVQGVTLTLTKETTEAVSLSVSRDATTALNTALTNLVKSYNDLNTAFRGLGAYNAETKQGAPLLGNSTLRQVSGAIRNAILSVPPGATGDIKRMSDLGLEMQKDGSLVFNPGKLSSAVNKDFDSVATLAAAFGTSTKKLTAGFLGTSGSITTATEGLNRSVDDIDKRREQLADRLTQVEARYRRQFSALDTLVASMNSTSNYLTQQLANLPGSRSN